jgi:hypothetical protein
MEVAIVCRTTPSTKTPFDAMRPQRRPMMSPTGAAPRAPKNVPAERIETMAEDWLEVTFNWPVLSR